MPPGGMGSPNICQLSTYIKKFKYEKCFKIKNKPFPGISKLTFYTIKPSAGLFIPTKTCETIPLIFCESKKFCGSES
jgi:hypothetical protein